MASIKIDQIISEDDFIARPAKGGPCVRIPAMGIHENVKFFDRLCTRNIRNTNLLSRYHANFVMLRLSVVFIFDSISPKKTQKGRLKSAVRLRVLPSCDRFRVKS